MTEAQWVRVQRRIGLCRRWNLLSSCLTVLTLIVGSFNSVISRSMVPLSLLFRVIVDSCGCEEQKTLIYKDRQHFFLH